MFVPDIFAVSLGQTSMSGTKHEDNFLETRWISRQKQPDAPCTMMAWLNKTTVYDDRIVVSTPFAHHVLTMTQRT
jgi:hypothetical protein